MKKNVFGRRWVILFAALVLLVVGSVPAFADYWVTYSGDGARGPVRLGQDVDWASGDTKIVSEEVIGWYQTNSGVFTVTEVTATGAEINKVDGVTATAAELSYLDITALGTGAASKAVVLDTGEDYTWPATGILTYGVLKDPAGTTLGSTAAELNLVDGSSATVPAAGKAAILDSGGDLRNISNVGAVNTGVTAVEYGDGYQHHTVLTVSQADAVTVADNAALCDGYLLYTFPAGEIIVENVSVSMATTLAEDSANAAAEGCVGTVLGSAAAATCGADAAGLEDLLGPITTADMAGTPDVLTVAVGAGTPVVLATAGSHLVHWNICSTWGNTAGADLTGDISGTVVIDWKFMQ